MRLPFVRQALDSDTQVEDINCAALVLLEYKQSYVWPADDLNDFNVVEHTAGNITVESGKIKIVGTATTIGVNGIWRAAGGVPGYVKYTFSTDGSVNTSTLVSQLATGTGLSASTTTLGRPTLRTNSTTNVITGLLAETVGKQTGFSTGTDYDVKMYILDTYRYRWFIDGIITAEAFNSDYAYHTTNPIMEFQCARASSTLYISDYAEHFGGFDTDSPTVDYVADAGDGKKWANFNLTNFAFDYSLTSANATFKYYYGDSATPSWSTEKTLAQLQAVGNLTDDYRYAMIQVLQNSDGTTQCPVTEVNATDATEGQAATAGGGAQLGAFETGAWR
jgi:hypothetical protein